MHAATTSTFSRDRLLPLDMLRGIAALIVAIGHAGLLSRSKDDYTMCVAFFYILSGYVLSYSYGAAISSARMTAYQFVIARIARLYPLHIATAAAVGVMWTAAVFFRGHRPPDLTVADVVETVTLTQSLYSGTWSLNLPSWSIGAEFWCGLILLPLCWPSRRGRVAVLIVAAIIFIAVDLNGGFIASVRGRYGIAMGCFAIGWSLHFVRLQIKSWLGWAIVFCAFLSLIFPAIPAEGHPLVELLYIAAFAASVLLLANGTMPKGTQRVASLSGDLSYGIYLWHWPLQRVLGPILTPAELLLFLTCLITISWLSFRVFECPMKNHIRAFALLRRKPATAAEHAVAA
jgi:peptidoglycan/LPS O-acetylase OafA/YrhL